jgi:hypothetical protein
VAQINCVPPPDLDDFGFQILGDSIVSVGFLFFGCRIAHLIVKLLSEGFAYGRLLLLQSGCVLGSDLDLIRGSRISADETVRFEGHQQYI